MSEKRIYRNHSAEFKAEAVRMVVEKKARRTEVARNLGISVSLLDTWIKNSKGGAEPKSKGKGSSFERIRELEKALAQAEMERDILKKALGYFAKENK